MRIIGLFLLGLLTAAGAAAQPVDLAPYRGERPVILVFSQVRDEVRAFSFHLELSNRWNSITARNIAVVDVDPVSYDVKAVAEQFSLGDTSFAILLFADDGNVLMVTQDETALPEMLRSLDLYRSHTEDDSTMDEPAEMP